jgi:ABC-2 type transport system ATP-binding protein
VIRMGDGVLIVDDLRKRYPGVQALAGLSFSVPKGAFFGLFGRNGAGKTTTLDIVTGLLMRDSGRVTILGEELRVEPEPETKARFAYVAGHLQLYDWMSCREHVEFVSQFYPTWDAAREAELLELFRIPLDQRVGTLSAGQNVQLQLLMALAHRPELLLIDEPGNLDAVVRQRLMETMIEAIADEEATIVMASHVINELDGVCDHLCIIDRGVALTSGPVESLVESVRRVHYRGVKHIPAEAWLKQVVSLRRHGDEARAVFVGYTSERAEALAQRLNVESYEAERLGLQDVFVALTEDRE